MHRRDDGEMEIWYIVLHYNKLTGCKKGENRIWGEMVQKDLRCVWEGVQACRFSGDPPAGWWRYGNARKSAAGEAREDGWRCDVAVKEDCGVQAFNILFKVIRTELERTQ